MNYSIFRSATNYEAVGVNHRALITRTLTKYPVDYALYRELLQNSADAQSTSAKITFETGNGAKVSSTLPPTIHDAPITKLIFENNGQVFNDADWNRLKEIAKGNPDESKIGAFGVGFYSVFELTDAPLVHSGNAVMSFHFVGDELRYSKAHSDVFVDGTLIDVPFREEGKMPDLTKFLSFVTQSFTLLRLEKVTLFVNDLELFHVRKHGETARPIEFPKELNKTSYNKTFTLAKITSQQIKLDINYLNATQMQKSDLSTAAGLFSFGRKMVSSMFTSSEDPTEVTKLVCHLQRIDAVADVSVSSTFRKKMIATVLKPPSKVVHMSMLSTTKVDIDRSTLKSPLSDAVFPAAFNDAKIVIGFPTKQSTGLKTHIALNQLVPTMERTAVDMSNATVKDWNSELMFSAGIMARCVYEHELKRCNNDVAVAAYTMKRFEMADSAPDQMIGQRYSAGFWGCLKVALLPTQLGIQPSSKVRLARSDVPSSLLKHTPMVSSEGSVFIQQMAQIGYLKELSIEDVALDLQHGPLDVATFVDLVKWAQSYSAASLKRVFDAAVISCDDKTVLLGQIKYYEYTEEILPATCLPPALIKDISASSLEKLGWTQLPVSLWLQNILSAAPKKSSLLDEQFAVEILTKLAAKWRSIPGGQTQAVTDILLQQPCIPTQKGMRHPNEAYVKAIALFPELPVISSSLDLPKWFYQALGVRESVDMKFVLDALHGSNLKWSSEDLVGYLVENRKKLRQRDWKVLQAGQFFEKSDGTLVKSELLFLPDSDLLQLGFDTLKWRNWQARSNAESLLVELGMRKAPTVLELFERASKLAKNDLAVKYYLKNYDQNGYNSADLKSTNYRIVPTTSGRESPKNCFYAPESALFGLKVVSGLQEFQSDRLGVLRSPPIPLLVNALKSRPPQLGNASLIFSYLSSRLSEFSVVDIDPLKKAAIVPVGQSHQVPSNVFFSGPDSELNKLFYIAQTSATAKPFLQRVGVRECPSTVEIAWKVVEDPTRVYQLMETSGNYLSLLRRFELEWATLAKDHSLVGRMKVSRFLVGEVRDMVQDETMDKADTARVELCSAPEVRIVDNVIIYNQFKHLIKACPQETHLEEFYTQLGARNLSASLLEKCTLGRISTRGDAGLEPLIKERLTLFLESTSKRRVNRRVDDLTVVFVESMKVERKLAETPSIDIATSAYMRASEPNTLYLMVKPDWFDVATILTRQFLKRPDPESAIVLELQLGSSLQSLRRKGYNVARLLKRQEEAKDKELRERLEKERLEKARLEKERLEEEAFEEKAREERKAAKALQQSTSHQKMLEPATSTDLSAAPVPAVETAPTPAPAPSPAPAQAPAPAPALPSIPLPKTTGSAPPMSSAAETASGYLSKYFKKAIQKQPTRQPQPQQSQVQQQQANDTQKIAQGEPQALEDTLSQGVQCSKPYAKDTQAGQTHQDAPPSLTVPLKCDGGRTTDLKVGAKLNDGVKLFIDRHAPPVTNSQIDHAVQLSSVLYRCCQIYQVPYNTIALYVGELELIAYNAAGSLFFNLAVFEDRCNQGWTPERHMGYWFTIMAHELAHNLVQDHGASHSYFTEMYIAENLAAFRQSSAE